MSKTKLNKSPQEEQQSQTRQSSGKKGQQKSTKARQTSGGRQQPIQAKQRPVKAKQQPVQAKHKPVEAKHEPIQRQLKTGGKGLPEPMKTNMEAMGGVNLDDVQVHRNSDKPVQMNALAYAQDNNIYLGQGQEQHLGHEAWHTVQQKQGRVKPTRMFKRKTPLNDDMALEREADEMAGRAAQLKCADCAHQTPKSQKREKRNPEGGAVQRIKTSGASNAIMHGVDLVRDTVKDGTEGIVDGAKEMYESAKEGISDIMGNGGFDLLDKVLPVGQGLSFQVNGGITWGIPLHTGGSTTYYVKRIDEKTVNLLVRKQGKLALDTGVGMSAFVGREMSDGKKAGVGLDAGANFQAGLLGTNIEEFNIPAEKFLRFAGKSLLASIATTGAGVMAAPINYMLGKEADQYRIRQKIDLVAFAQADAEALAGIKRPSDNFQDKKITEKVSGGKSTWGRHGDRKTQSSKPSLLDLDPLALLNSLSKAAQVQLKGQVGGGVEQKKEGEKVTTSLYLEGELSTIIQVPIPLIGTLLRMLPGGIGLGVELIFTQEPDKEPQTHLKVYQKGGEDQVYEGGASQQSFLVNLSSLASPEEIIAGLQSGQVPVKVADIKNALEQVAFFNRILLTGGPTAALGGFLRKQQGTRSLLSDSTKSATTNMGIDYGVYLDLGGEMKGPDFMKVVEQLLPIGKDAVDATKNAKGIAQTSQALQDFFAARADTPEVNSIIDEVLDRTVVNTALVRIHGNVGGGFSGKLAAGGKVRGDLSIQGGAFCEIDYVKISGEGGKLNLRTLINDLPNVLNKPLDYLPGCPLLESIYSAFKE